MKESELLNLTTQQLHYLVALERATTVQAAAADLGVSASALSQGLTELERRIGVPLFERRGRSRALTDRGRELVVLATRVLGATRDLTVWAHRSSAGDVGRVGLGMIDIAAIVHFPEVLARFRTERPDVELHLSVASSSELLDDVAAGRLDAAVVVGPQKISETTAQLPDRPELSIEQLLTEELVVYAPPSGRGQRARRDPATWGPWVTFPPGSTTRSQIATALRGVGADFVVAAESHQPDVLRQLVNLGMGWTVLPRPQAESAPFPLRAVRPVPLLLRRLVLARRVEAPLHAAADHLIDRLRSEAASR